MIDIIGIGLAAVGGLLLFAAFVYIELSGRPRGYALDSTEKPKPPPPGPAAGAPR